MKNVGGFMKYLFRISRVFIFLFLLPSVSQAVPLEVPYSGKLTDNAGVALTGPVNLKFSFFNSSDTVGDTTPLSVQLLDSSNAAITNNIVTSVPLANGVFQVMLRMSATHFHTIFPDGSSSKYVQVFEVNGGGTVLQSFPRQRFGAVPYALKVPVDGSSITYSASGQVTVGTVPSYQVSGLGSLAAKSAVDLSFGSSDFSGSLPTSSVSGLGSLAAQSSVNLGSQVSSTLGISNGGTGAATAAQNSVFSGPSSGGTGAPSFRALETTDIPSLPSTQITGLGSLATASSVNLSTQVSGTLGTSNGGTQWTTSGSDVYYSSGKVGVGGAASAEKLEVTGNIRTSGQYSNGTQTISSGTTSIDWNNGNSISTDYSCASAFAMANLRNGGTYTLVVTSTATTQCSFSTTTTGNDSGTVSYRFKPANTTRTGSSHTIYTLMRIGSVVYVSWTSGF